MAYPVVKQAVLGTSDFSRRIRAVVFTEWTLGFKRYSLHHVSRVSTVLRPGGFVVFGLSEHAAFPSSFRFQVDSVTQGHCTQPFPCCTGINYLVARRTHPNQDRVIANTVRSCWCSSLDSRPQPCSMSRRFADSFDTSVDTTDARTVPVFLITQQADVGGALRRAGQVQGDTQVVEEGETLGRFKEGV